MDDNDVGVIVPHTDADADGEEWGDPAALGMLLLATALGIGAMLGAAITAIIMGG